MRSTGDLVSAVPSDHSLFGLLARGRAWWLIVLAIGLLASVPLALKFMAPAPGAANPNAHVGGPR